MNSLDFEGKMGMIKTKRKLTTRLPMGFALMPNTKDLR